MPIFGVISEYRPFLILTCAFIILWNSIGSIRLDLIATLSLLFSCIGFIWLFFQISVLQGNYAYLFNLGIFIVGLLLSRHPRSHSYFEGALPKLLFFQLVVEASFYLMPNGFEVRSSSFYGELGLLNLFRPTGSLGDPNYFGSLLFLCVLGERHKLNLIGTMVAFMSLSKGAILSYVITKVTYSRKSPLALIYYLTLSVSALLVVMYLREGISISSNLERIHAVWAVVTQNTIFNLNMLGDAIVRNSERSMVVHNLFLQTMYTNIFVFIGLVLTLRGLSQPIYLLVFTTSMLLDFSSQPLFLFVIGLYSAGGLKNAKL